jgi:hypothetical protein
MLPAAVVQHEVIEPVRQRLAGDGHTELVRVGEVRERPASGLGALAEDHVLRRAVEGPPVEDAALERPPDAIVGKGVRVRHLQMTEQRHCLNGGITLEDAVRDDATALCGSTWPGGALGLDDYRRLAIRRSYRSVGHMEISVAAPPGTGVLPRSTALPDTQRTPPIPKSP